MSRADELDPLNLKLYSKAQNVDDVRRRGRVRAAVGASAPIAIHSIPKTAGD
jgi:hypothetical protein